MPLAANLNSHLAEAIGTALGKDQLKDAVREATGKELYVVYAAEGDPLAKAIISTLESLERVGRERWLLTYCLASTISDERLRKLIFRSCPETLKALPSVDDQVRKVQASLQGLLKFALQPDLIDDFRARRANLVPIAQHITMMVAYKGLHECLHGLHAKLTLGARLTASAGAAAAPPIETVRTQIRSACTTARDAAAKMPTGSDEQQREATWIEELERSAANLRQGRAATASVATVDTADAERIVRLQLARLNQQIFATARLPLHPLYEDLPDELQDDREGLYEAHESAVLALTPTVLARALKHKLWQDAENEFAPMLAFLDVPSSDPLEFFDHWLQLKGRIAWLASLDPDAEWARQATLHSDDIDDQLTDLADKLADAQAVANLKEALETFHGLVLLSFLAVDAGVKADCTSLCEIGKSVKSIVAELARA